MTPEDTPSNHCDFPAVKHAALTMALEHYSRGQEAAHVIAIASKFEDFLLGKPQENAK